MTTDLAAPPVLETRDRAVLTLTLNRPQRLNAITDDLLDSLTGSLSAAEEDGSIRAIVLTGAGRAFCSGQDLKAAAEEGGSVDIRAKLRDHYGPAIRALRTVSKPVVAAINGPAAGAGFSLALAADLRIAAESATFVQAFVRIGLIPDASSTYLLPRVIGPARAAEMMLLGDTVDAERAAEIGLVSRVLPDAELLTQAHELAARLAAGPRSIGYIKEALRLSPDNDFDVQLQVEERLQEESTKTADFFEGVAAFIEKRPARFSGA